MSGGVIEYEEGLGAAVVAERPAFANRRLAFERAKPKPALWSTRRSPTLWVGGGMVALVVLAGIVVPLLTPYAPDQLNAAPRLAAPSLAHPFGADHLGRDMLSRVASGVAVAARIAGLSVLLAMAVGLVLGSLAGYYGGWLDQLLSRAIDAWLGLPAVLVAIVIVARLGASLNHLVVALGFIGIPAFYRVVRSTTLSARAMAYVEAATCIGATDRRIMWRHILPNVISPLIVLTTLRLGTVLITGGSLSFIGLGVQPPLPEWGALLAAGRGYMDTAWWLAVFPGLAMTFTVVGLNWLGDGLRDALDPALRRW